MTACRGKVDRESEGNTEHTAHGNRRSSVAISQCLVVSLCEDRPFPELIERVNIPIRTLKARLVRGMKLVKQSLTEPMREGP